MISRIGGKQPSWFGKTSIQAVSVKRPKAVSIKNYPYPESKT
jgi:hypothetical protein